MCGIAGLRRFDGQPVHEHTLRAMADAQSHRGPDDSGFWLAGDVGFGHRRLSIIDVAGSPQPMRVGSTHVCFNGEIFNYRSLRDELGRAGHSFRTAGDTEVLLALFRSRGAKGVEALDGQFAYAIYDETSRELWLFRDRVGILPLHYYWDGKVFAFASELKAILAVLPAALELDPKSLKEYLAYRSVPAPHTLFRGIQKLPPGHWLCLRPDGSIRVEAWWSLPRVGEPERVSPAEAVERVDRGIRQAVESRMIADVPIGALLSGGVDSSLIVALMSQLTQGGARVETFSAGFDDERVDEIRYARQVSEMFSTRHHEVIVKPTDFETLWPKLTWHRDAPVSEPADLAVFRLASEARGHVKVLLSGEGSDELFGGYPKYRFRHWAALAGLVPPPLRAPLFETLERALPQRLARIRVMLRAMSGRDEAERFQTWFAPFTRYERDRLLPGPAWNLHEAIASRALGDRLQRMLYFDCHTWLVDNLLERGDRMAMAASIELRPPFLAHELVELAFSLPSDVKVRGGTTKWVVKEVARRYLPETIVDRRKVGFRVPLDAWFRSGLAAYMRDVLLSRNSFVGSLFDRREIERLVASHLTGRRDEELRIWTLLCLETWHDVFFNQRATTAA